MSAGRPVIEVVEITDPACPWAWGSEPTFRRLRAMLDPAVRWRRVYGILFDADDDPAPDPAAETAWYARYIVDVSAHTGAPYPVRLERVARTSWPASQAAKAAQAQGAVVAERVLRRLREATFVLGRPPDTVDRVLAAVFGVPGLDSHRLAVDLAGPDTVEAVRRDWRTTRRPCAEAIRADGDGPHNGRAKRTDGGYRYALPTVLLRGPGGRAVVPGWRPLGEYLDAAERVSPGSIRAVSHRDPAVLLADHRTLTGPELLVLAGTRHAPPNAVEVATAGGPLWLSPDEAAVHPAVHPPVDRPGG